MKNLLLLLFLSYHSCIFTQNQQPNILWLVTEDISPNLSFYGDSTAKTPNLDVLAAESMIYDNAFAPVSVCAPARSAIITGRYPTSIGTMHMRTGKDITTWGKRKYAEKVPITDLVGDTIREYAAVVPEGVKCFTEYLRMEGYYCTNNAKTDYQFAAPLTAWDENGNKAHWRNRPENQPFFAVFNTNLTHESKLWKHDEKPLTVAPESVPVPPYLPDTKVSRCGIARHYSNIELMDKWVRKIIQQLKEDGLYDNTIIFFYSDHGGPLPRQKRAIFDSGLRVPFMVKHLNSAKKGRTERLISFVDLAPTVLSLANIPTPNDMEGKAFLGQHEGEPNQYIHASADRFDEHSDRSRAVHDGRFLYIENDFLEKPHYIDIGYRKNIPLMQEMLKLKEKKKLNATQMRWFLPKEPKELYDCQTDPHNLQNLIDDPQYADVQQDLRTELVEHWQQHFDFGRMLNEANLIAVNWPDNQQPRTPKPMIDDSEKYVILNCASASASIGFLISDKAKIENPLAEKWQIYPQTFTVPQGKYLHVIAERIGYKTSEITTKRF